MNTIIYKTLLIPVNCKQKDLKYLYNCNKLSAQVWNFCIELDKKFKEENGKFIGMSDLQKQTKKCVQIHSKGIHHVVHKYLFARDAMWKSIKAKHENSNKVNLPYKQKKYYPTGWDYQALKVDYDKGVIYLSKPMADGKKSKPVKCYAKTIPKNIAEIELIYRNKLYLAVKYKTENNLQKIKSDNVSAIDLGEIHSITAIDNNENALIVTGRKLRSIKRLRNKEQGGIYKRLSKCTKGSIQYKKYMKALNNLKTKFDFKIVDAVHKITKHYVDYCIKNEINIVYYGDLDSCTRNSKDRIGRFVGQKLNQWEYGQIMQQLHNKLERHNIKLIKVSEAYSSQTCAKCGKLNKPKGRNYKCNCGYKIHRDVNGAINILNMNNEYGYQIIKYDNFKYLRIE